MIIRPSDPLKDKLFRTAVSEEFSSQPLKQEEMLTEKETGHLPETVKKYLRYSGAIGKPKPQNFRLDFDAEMFRRPGDPPMKSYSCQYNFLGNPARFFLMKAHKLFIPFKARHIYRNQQATFEVRVADMFRVVDLKGEELTKAETVTVLNDLCIFAPGSLADKRFSWQETGPLSSKVTLVNGRYQVSAQLFFDDNGALINFISDDRYALQDDGTIKLARWSTPMGDYKAFDGRMIPTRGETIWHYPEGDFTYGKFILKSVRYNLSHCDAASATEWMEHRR